MSLHILNKSPADAATWRACLNACGTGDSVLLIEDAVFHTLPGPSSEALLASGASIYVLGADLDARGLQKLQVSDIKRIEYADFVRLCVDHPKILSWY